MREFTNMHKGGLASDSVRVIRFDVLPASPSAQERAAANRLSPDCTNHFAEITSILQNPMDPGLQERVSKLKPDLFEMAL